MGSPLMQNESVPAPLPAEATPSAKLPETVTGGTSPAGAPPAFDDKSTAPFPFKSDEPAPTFRGAFGRYQVLQEISRGGMGVVYRARDTLLNRVIALKMIRSGNLANTEEVER